MTALRSLCALLVAPLLLLLTLHAPPAAAETTTCTQINSLPTVISTPGVYCLNFNFAASYATAAININSNNVLLDCNDHVVTQIGASSVSGVYVSNKQQVEVRNCALVGFARGISFFESSVGASRNNIVAGNQIRKAKGVGIQMAGTSNVVEDNHVSENQGMLPQDYTYGILLYSFEGHGVGNVIRRNVVTDIAPAQYVRVTGIYLLDVDNTQVDGNKISAMYPPLDLGVYGIVGSPLSNDNTATNNTVLAIQGSNPPVPGPINYGGASYDGIRFDANNSAFSHNVCVGNVVGHFVSDILGEGSTGCTKLNNHEF